MCVCGCGLGGEGREGGGGRVPRRGRGSCAPPGGVGQLRLWEIFLRTSTKIKTQWSVNWVEGRNRFLRPGQWRGLGGSGLERRAGAGAGTGMGGAHHGCPGQEEVRHRCRQVEHATGSQGRSCAVGLGGRGRSLFFRKDGRAGGWRRQRRPEAGRPERGWAAGLLGGAHRPGRWP